MVVCDICWGVPEWTAAPYASAKEGTSQRGARYLFGPNAASGKADLCGDCIELLQHRDWKTLAERSHDALLKRLE
jgi:hypothetical protein